MTLLHLPAEVRLQILERLPIQTLLPLQTVSRDLYHDVQVLFNSVPYVDGLLSRVHEKIGEEHKIVLEKYLRCADAKGSDELARTMFTLIRLMKYIVHLRTTTVAPSDGHRPEQLKQYGHVVTSRRIVHNIVSRCEAAADLCAQEGADLWTTELRKMLYPPARPSFLSV